MTASQEGSAQRRRPRVGTAELSRIRMSMPWTTDTVSAMTSTTVGPSAEEMRPILQQSLKEHGSLRFKELADRAAAAERDAAQYQQRYEEAQYKIERLEEQIRAESGSAGELRKICAEQEATIDGFKKVEARMYEERDWLEEKDVVGSEAERAGFKKEAARLEEER